MGPDTVLPAAREDIAFETADGLTLVGELALPIDRPAVATALCLHPLPTHGGSMDSHLLRKMANRLPATDGIAVLRFNTRGTSSDRGTSEGTFGGGVDERLDVAAALDFAEFRELPRVWLVGWSFGTELTLQYGLEPLVVGTVLISPPLRTTSRSQLDAWAADGRPLIALVPEFDDYLRPTEARERFAAVDQAEIIAVEGARHLFVGAKYTDRVLAEVVSALAG